MCRVRPLGVLYTDWRNSAAMSDRIPLTELKRQRTEAKKEALKELADDSPSERTNLVSNGDREVESYQGNKLFSYESESSGATPRSVSPNRELVEGTTTNLQTLTNLMKGFVGTGILALPNAMMHVGLVVGSLGLMVMAVVTVHCMHLLVECSRILSKRMGRVALSYGEVAEESFRYYNPKTAVVGRIVVDIFLCLTQMGFCCVYFIFVASTLQQMIGGLDTRAWAAVLLLPIMLFSFIRDLRWISQLSTIANAFIIISIIIIVQFAARHIGVTGENEIEFAGWAGLPMFFGIVMFAFEGIGVVLPLENKMAHPHNYGMIMNVGLGIVTTLYALVAIVGFLFCRDTCQGSITLNLPNEPLYMVVKILFAMDILLTYNIQFYVAMQIIPPPILKRVPEEHQNLAEYGIRVATVTCTCLLAIIVPQLANFVSLVGAFACTSLAIVFPTLFHLMLFASEEDSAHMSPLTFIKDAFILVFGFVGFIFGTYASIVQIIQQFERDATMGTFFTKKNATDLL